MKVQYLMLCLLICLLPASGALGQHGSDNDFAPARDLLSDASRDALGALVVQDYKGRLKPLDTLSREMVMKISRENRFDDRESLDLFLSWFTHDRYWFHRPVISVRHSEIKGMLNMDPESEHISAANMLDENGRYRLSSIESVLRKPDAQRTKMERKLLSLDERTNLLFMSMRQGTLRLYPVPEDENQTWLAIGDILPKLEEPVRGEYLEINNRLVEALQSGVEAEILASCAEHHALQDKYGGDIVISRIGIASELMLNRHSPFTRIFPVYIAAFLLLVAAWVNALVRRKGAPYTFRHPLYLSGYLVFGAGLAIHLWGFVLRWIAAGRAPLSNGYESLIWISLIVGLVGFLFDWRERRGLILALAALLMAVILKVSLLSTFDPAIGPLMPVLSSYWLIIHVTVIVGSYGFLALGALVAMMILILLLFKAPGRETVRESIGLLHKMEWKLLALGLGLLSIGTLLGAVWANESWGRYWGWDAKETWSLVSIAVYAIVVHLRFMPRLNRPWPLAAAGLVAISAILMTYFGVNYFLTSLHSYAGGEPARVPGWVYIVVLVVAMLLQSSYICDRGRSWKHETKRDTE
ncbi:MAG: cytochrome c biogenesis protein CcsA [bacterium]|nr:cytochrome c biogenesis protein CcsA [bacterium]